MFSFPSRIIEESSRDDTMARRSAVAADRRLHWLMPVRPGLDQREADAHGLLVNAGLSGAAFALLYAAVSHLIGFGVGVALMLASFVLLLAILALFRLAGRFRLCANLYLACCFFVAILGCSFYTGGLHSMALPWFSLVPLMSALLLGFGVDTVVWTALACIAVLAYGLAGMGGYRFPMLYETSLADSFNMACTVGLVLILSLIAYAFGRKRERETILVQKAAQEAALKNAETAALEKKAFLATMGQEIRTPLCSILGLTYLLGKSELSPKQGERLDKIRKAGEHLLALNNQLLDLSGAGIGKLKPERIEFPTGALPARTGESAARPASPLPAADLHDDLLQRLKGIPGFNAELGFDNLDHSLETYIPLLGKYVGHYRGQMNIFREHLDASNLAEARQFVHSLKGAAAFLGAVQIHMMAAEIDMAFREQYPVEDIKPLWGDLEAEQEALLGALLAVLPEEVVVSGTQATGVS